MFVCKDAVNCKCSVSCDNFNALTVFCLDVLPLVPSDWQGSLSTGSCTAVSKCECAVPTPLSCAQNTKVQGAISHLFEGHTFNFVECINVDYKSTRKESYMDLQLDVKGCRTVYDSFVKYTEVEKLDGQNQYKAEGHGLQVVFHHALHLALSCTRQQCST